MPNARFHYGSPLYPRVGRFRCEGAECGAVFVAPDAATHCPGCGRTAAPLPLPYGVQRAEAQTTTAATPHEG